MSVLQTIDLKKYYGTKPDITRALDDVNLSGGQQQRVAIARLADRIVRIEEASYDMAF